MGSHARNYAPVGQGGAGAPPALLPPYVDTPEGVIVREAASSRVPAGRDLVDRAERYLERRTAGWPDQISRVYRDAFWSAFVRACGQIEEALHDA